MRAVPSARDGSIKLNSMIFSKKFDVFSFQRFSDFIYDLFDYHGFWGIRFTTYIAKDIFSGDQLTHASVDININDERGFRGAWQKRQNIKKVGFTFYARDERSSIKMSFNLDKKSILLDEAVNVSLELILSILGKIFVLIDGKTKIASKTNRWRGARNINSTSNFFNCLNINSLVANLA